jgi:predicted dehydrogenase
MEGQGERAGGEGVVKAAGGIERLKAEVQARREEVRRPRFLVAERLAPFRRRGTDVGVVLDLMIHDLDLVLDMTGEKVEEVEAVGVPVLTESVDLANARLTFRGGAVAEITASRVSTRSTRRLRVFQETGYLSLDLASGEGTFLRRTAPGLPVEAGDGLQDVVERERLAADGDEGEEPLRRELRTFLRAVRDGNAEVVTADEARPALELALRITREIEESTHVPA